MKLTALSLYHFKNYTQWSLNVDEEVICLVGRNGCGKTSLLDAIYFLCFTKSYLLHLDAYSITKGLQGMRLQGSFKGQVDDYSVECIIRENGKKEVWKNGIQYKRFAEHIGLIPCIFIAPDDIELIMEGSEVRRKFMDILCSMLSADYLNHLSDYNKLLTQRNALLRQWHEVDPISQSLIHIYDEQMSTHADAIYRNREAITLRLIRHSMELYAYLSNSEDQINLTYSSSLQNGNLKEILEANLQKDILTQRTNYGIHKDDWLFELNGMPMKQAASQGQRKSFIFGLKLAQYHVIEEMLNKHAIILLDDIFEKLDANRSHRLVTYLMKLPSQKWITDTHEERMAEALENVKAKTRIIELG